MSATLLDGGCVLDNPSVDKLFTFQDMENNRNENGEYKYSNTIAPEKAGEYSLFFANCEPNTLVSFDITAGAALFTHDILRRTSCC